jgi:hypothetical protein
LQGIDPNTISAYAAIVAAAAAAIALYYNARQTKAAKASYEAAQGSYREAQEQNKIAASSYREAQEQSRIAAETLAQSAKVHYYEIIKDFSEQIQDLEGSDKRNKDHRSFAIRYLNILDRLVYLADKDVIQGEYIIKYFRNSIGGAMGLFEMKEYSSYLNKFKDLNYWCVREGIEAAPPPLPYPNIRIKNGLIHDSDGNVAQLHYARVGDFVTWFSGDNGKHRIISGKDQNDPNAGQEFDSGESGVLALTSEGRTFSHEFMSAGSYDYFCRIHPTEVGKVIVQ